MCNSFYEHRMGDYEYVSYVKVTDVNVCPKIKKHDLFSSDNSCPESSLPRISIVESRTNSNRLKKQTAQVNLRRYESMSSSFSSSNSDEPEQDGPSFRFSQYVKTPEKRRSCTNKLSLKPFNIEQDKFSPERNTSKIIRTNYSDEEF